MGKLQGNPKVLVVLVEPNTKLGLLAGHGATVFLRAYLPVLSKDPSETRASTRFVPRLLLASNVVSIDPSMHGNACS